MAEWRLEHSWEFFDEVLKPNYDEFVGSVTTWRTAVNMTSSLFHMRDWVYALDLAAAEQTLGQSFATPYELWKHVEGTVPGAPFVRDVANASKHVTLNFNPSTSMTHISNTYIQSGYGRGAYGRGRYGTPSTLMDEKVGRVSLDACAKEVFDFWEALTVAIRN